jgi:poly(beta-D-mannuronate) lyase
MSNVYNIDINGSEISDFKTVLFAYKDSMADTLSFVASKFNNCRSGIILAAETDAKGDYNAEVVTIDNCSFNNIEGGVIDFYRGGYDESTIGGCLTIMNSRFTSCGGQGQDNTLFKTTGIVNVAIENNVFKSNPVKYIAILWGEKNNKHSNNEIINSGKILVEEFLKQKLVY